MSAATAIAAGGTRQYENSSVPLPSAWDSGLPVMLPSKAPYSAGLVEDHFVIRHAISNQK